MEQSVEVMSEVCQCAVAVLQKTHRDGTLTNIKKCDSSIPRVPDIDITAPIDNHHIEAHSPSISVTGLMSYLQVSLRIANIFMF